MSVLYIAIPVALLIAVISVTAFILQVRNGQLDDLETPPRRMLFDDVEQRCNLPDANDDSPVA